MKKILLIILYFCGSIVIAQVKIGENPNTLDVHSILELESSERAFILPRVTTDQMNAITPLHGAMVYNEDEACIFYYDGTGWNNLCSGRGGGTGNGTWGNIKGTLSDQTDLIDEFDKYVDLSTPQTIDGEKTLTEKFTVDTGNPNDQIAEFNGRVKGENGIAPEDFVTRLQLDFVSAEVGTGNSTWGGITGTLENQTDLIAKFDNYVDLTSPQTIEGEKTFTEKFTVDTGNADDQIAEFIGRVKGEDGYDPEDFVTRAQLDALTIGGHTGAEGSVFFSGANLAPTEDNDNLFFDKANKQLRVGSYIDLINDNPTFGDGLTTLNVQGSISLPIGQETTLTEQVYTTIISWTTFITLPDPATCFGRIYVIKIRPDVTVGIRGYKGYNDSQSINQLEFPSGKVTQIQSNGYAWEQIN